MKKIEGNKLVALLLSAGMVTTLFAACTINTDELGQGISDLGNAFITSETEAPTASAPSETNTEVTETTETSEDAPEPTPSATPTATPSPTPLPQRVDFSEYTDIDLADNFTVTSEDFAESTHSDDDKEVFAKFEGNRLVVTEAKNETARDAINLIVDGFYQDAEGAYKRVAAKAKSEYLTTGVVEETYEVKVDFDYQSNGRVLSVLMTYTVAGPNENYSGIDFASFDMLTGHYITLDSYSAQAEELEAVLRKDLENSIKYIIPAGTVDEATGEVATTDMLAKTPKADEFVIFYVAPTASETADKHFVTLYGMSAEGKIWTATVAIDDYADQFNRYGKSVLFV